MGRILGMVETAYLRTSRGCGYIISAFAGMTDSGALNFKKHFNVTKEQLHGFSVDRISPDSVGFRRNAGMGTLNFKKRFNVTPDGRFLANLGAHHLRKHLSARCIKRSAHAQRRVNLETAGLQFPSTSYFTGAIKC